MTLDDVVELVAVAVSLAVVEAVVVAVEVMSAMRVQGSIYI